MRLLDSQFRYVPAVKTNVAATWARFGFRPTTDAERRARQNRPYQGESRELEPGLVSATDGLHPQMRGGDGKVAHLKLAASK